MPHLQNIVIQVEIIPTPWLHPVTSNVALKTSFPLWILKYAAIQYKCMIMRRELAHSRLEHAVLKLRMKNNSEAVGGLRGIRAAQP